MDLLFYLEEIVRIHSSYEYNVPYLCFRVTRNSGKWQRTVICAYNMHDWTQSEIFLTGRAAGTAAWSWLCVCFFHWAASACRSRSTEDLSTMLSPSCPPVHPFMLTVEMIDSPFPPLGESLSSHGSPTDAHAHTHTRTHNTTQLKLHHLYSQPNCCCKAERGRWRANLPSLFPNRAQQRGSGSKNHRDFD